MASLRLYDTLTHEKCPFIPLKPDKVGMYVCGVTVYDSSHIGHARAAVVFDVVYRFLKVLGYHVIYVRNFTDIDDKIIQRSNELKLDYRELTQKYIDQYQLEMRQLNVLDPSHQPRATEHIDDMIQMIHHLIRNRIAYSVAGDVFINVSQLRGYGKLSRRTVDEMRSGSRIEVDERKKNPEDFALWKAAKPGEPSWESPWGQGRPGWHIECSAMSMHYLGENFDIHGGGCDLVFPHHENEIAQSEAYTGKTYARYWMHNELVTIQHSKMSKSLGNVFFLTDLFQEFSPRVVRFFLVSKHYRTPIDFSIDAMKEAGHALERVESSLARALDISGSIDGIPPDETLLNTYYQALADDFNTPKAIGIVFQQLGHVNTLMDKGVEVEKLQTSLSTLLKMLDVLGIQPDLNRFVKVKETASCNEEQVKEVLERGEWTPDEVQWLVKAREGARRARAWNVADLIRNKLIEVGIEIRDEKDGVKIIKK